MAKIEARDLAGALSLFRRGIALSNKINEALSSYVSDMEEAAASEDGDLTTEQVLEGRKRAKAAIARVGESLVEMSAEAD